MFFKLLFPSNGAKILMFKNEYILNNTQQASALINIVKEVYSGSRTQGIEKLKY